MVKPVNLSQIARALGGRINGDWAHIRGPGHSGSDRSLGFKFDKKAPDGFRVNSFANDDPDECRKYLKGRLRALAGGEPLHVTQNVTTEDVIELQQQDRTIRALEIWEQSTPANGTVVQAYLEARGCEFPTSSHADVLRFHPSCPFGCGERVPAMIALMRDVQTGEPKGIHRTALADDGTRKRVMPNGRPSKMMLGAAKRAAVQLRPASTVLGIAEGIETALSASQIFDLPVWPVLSAGSIRLFPAIPGLKRLVIFADYDDAGLKAAVECARRHVKTGTEVEVRYPPTVNSDWNDYQRMEST